MLRNRLVSSPRPRKVYAFAAVLVAVTALMADVAQAQIGCGSVILPGQKVKLEANVGPCTAATGGITVVGPGSLDLNGYAVTCLLGLEADDVPVGIHVVGEKAKIKNGSVLACRKGVQLVGDGRHKVIKVTAAVNHEEGFAIYTHRNVVKNSEALDNQEYGFNIWDIRNTVKRSLASGNDIAGFIVRTGENKLVKNESVDNGQFGFFVEMDAGGGNKFLRNLATGNGEDDLASDFVDTCFWDIWRGNVYVTKNPSCIQ